MREKTDRNLDKMVKRMDSPFTTKILECPLPLKFRLPQLKSFDGLKDPLDHITTFRTTLSLKQTPNEILCRSFPTTLKGAARMWFRKLGTSSINNFEQLGSSFVRHVVGGQHQKRMANHLLTIKQGEREPLRSYVKRLTREVLEVDEVDVQLTTFKAGLKSREFVVALAKIPPQTMVEMLLKAQMHMNVEDSLAVMVEEHTPKEKESAREDHRGRKREGEIVRPTPTRISGETIKLCGQ